MPHAGKDLLYALRTLARKPAFTAVVVATLALGIGANTAIFSLVDGVILKPLPFRDPDALLMVWQKRASIPQLTVSELDLDDYRARNHVFQALGGFMAPGSKTLIMTGAGEPAEIAPAFTTQNYFSLLGLVPLIGRDFLPEEGRRGHDAVAILSYALWQSRFGGSPAVLRQQITLNHQKLQIVGVMGPLVYPADADLFIPSTWADPQPLGRNFREFDVVGRLRPGQTQESAQREMEAISFELGREYPVSDNGVGVHILPLRDEIVGKVREPILLLQAAVILILLIACGNVANLLLVQAAVRQKEIAIRIALGAGRGRIAAQFAAECLILLAAGSALGLLLAFSFMPLIHWLGSERIPRLQHVAIDARVLLFTLGIAVFAGILFGVIPALRFSSANLNETLRAGGRTSKADSGRLRNVLVAGEVALALVVVVGASLLVRSRNRILDVHPGFRPDHVLVGHIRLPSDHYEQAEVENFYKRLLPRIAAIPGVVAVSTATTLPMVGPFIEMRFALQGMTVSEPGKYPVMTMTSVDPGFFETMGIPILRGRTFRREEVDDFDHEKCIINQTFADTYFSGQNPVGRIVLNGVVHATPEPCEVVGVVGDTKLLGLDAPPRAALYFAAYVVRDHLVVRTTADPLSVAQAVRREVAAANPEQPLSNIRTMDDVLSRSLSQRSFAVVLLVMFASVGVLLAALGLYGVMSYSVTQRTHEIGVRMALGARPSAVFVLVLWEALLVTGSGLLIGALISGAVTRVMQSLLFGIGTNDLVSFGVASFSLFAVSALATFIPAYRASRVDPLVALRYE